MKKLKIDLKLLKYLCFSLLFFCFFTKSTFSNEISFEIQGNEFTDSQVILSLLENKPNKLNNEYSNYIIKTLDNSLLFKKK